MQQGHLLSHGAPGDAGQIVGAAVAAVHRQDHVADLAAKGRAAEGRLLAQHAAEENAVQRFVGVMGQRLGEGGDDQTAALAAFVIEGTQLAGDMYAVAGGHRRQQQKRPGDDDGQLVRLTGQAQDGQGKAVERTAVVHMGQQRRVLGHAPQLHAVVIQLHSTPRLLRCHSLCGAGLEYAPFSKRLKYGIIQQKE